MSFNDLILPIRLIAHKYTLSIYLTTCYSLKKNCMLLGFSLALFLYFSLFVCFSLLFSFPFFSIDRTFSVVRGSVSIRLPFISENNSQNSNKLLWINMCIHVIAVTSLVFFFSFILSLRLDLFRFFLLVFFFILAIRSHARWIIETHQISQIK